jgi:hypothetical protein
MLLEDQTFCVSVPIIVDRLPTIRRRSCKWRSVPESAWPDV